MGNIFKQSFTPHQDQMWMYTFGNVLARWVRHIYTARCVCVLTHHVEQVVCMYVFIHAASVYVHRVYMCVLPHTLHCTHTLRVLYIGDIEGFGVKFQYWNMPQNWLSLFSGGIRYRCCYKQTKLTTNPHRNKQNWILSNSNTSEVNHTIGVMKGRRDTDFLMKSHVIGGCGWDVRGM